MSTLGQIVRHAAQVNPYGPALMSSHQTNWREFSDRTAKLAGGLRSLGVKDGERIGILALNSYDYFQLYFAVPWAGAVLVPINTRWSLSEIHDCLKDSDCSTLLVDCSFAKHIEHLHRALPHLRLIALDVAAEAHAIGPLLEGAPIEEMSKSDQELAFIMYTGGTTGRSKGVMITHRHIVNGAIQVASELRLSRHDLFLQTSPMFHNGGLIMCILATLAAAGSVVLPTFDVSLVLQTVAKRKLTVMFAVPTMLRMLLNSSDFTQFKPVSLKTIIYGASPISGDLIAKTRTELPLAKLYQAYGQTECGPAISLLHPEDHERSEYLASAGQALCGMDIGIFGIDGERLGCGVLGEVCARGINVTVGYWNRPDENERLFRGGWLRTGDVGYLDDRGYLFIVDRLKDMIISGGENIFSIEVENALYQHPDVAECAVFGIPNAIWGETVHAIVVPKPGRTMTEKMIVEHCEKALAGFKRPRSLEIRAERLPCSPVGKILKAELREQFWQNENRAVH